jgi:hypothetical protein
VLKALRAPTAHSQSITVVTYDTLVVAVQAQFTDADPTKVDVMAVLDCLQHLAVSMNTRLCLLYLHDGGMHTYVYILNHTSQLYKPSTVNSNIVLCVMCVALL